MFKFLKEVKNDAWKRDIVRAAEDFWSTRATYENLAIPNRIKQDKTRLTELEHALSEFNRLNSALYFHLAPGNASIHCYGNINPVKTKIEELKKMFASDEPFLSSPKKGIKPKALMENPIQPPMMSKPPLLNNNNLPLLPAPTIFSTPPVAYICIDSNSLTFLCINNCKQIVNDLRFKIYCKI